MTHVQGMCHACARRVQGVSNACMTRVQGVCKASLTHDQGMCDARATRVGCVCEASLTHVQGVCEAWVKACPRHVQCVCKAFVQGVCKACMTHVQGMCKVCVRCVQGMYKACARRVLRPCTQPLWAPRVCEAPDTRVRHVSKLHDACARPGVRAQGVSPRRRVCNARVRPDTRVPGVCGACANPLPLPPHARAQGEGPRHPGWGRGTRQAAPGSHIRLLPLPPPRA